MGKVLCFFFGFSLLVQTLQAQKIKALSICAGNSISIAISTDINKTYQWQVQTPGSSVYNNIASNTFYSGVNSGTLSITAAATNMAGYKYRCLITEQLNTISSDITVLKFKAIWSGNTDSIWNNSGNWNCGIVPDENTEVIIQPGAAHYPFINFNITCRKLSMAPNSSLHLVNGFKINITGSDSLLPETIAPQKMLVDSFRSVLLSTEAETETGLFRYNNFPGYKNISEGDFLIEPRNYGYLRRIEMVDSNSNGVRFYTSQGTMSQLYKDSGSINQTIIMPDANNPFSGSGGRGNKSDNPVPLSLAIPDFTVSFGAGSIKFRNFFIQFSPNPTLNFNIKNKYLKLGFVNVNYGYGFDADVAFAPGLQTDPPGEINIDITDKIQALQALYFPFTFGPVFGHMKFNVVLSLKEKVSVAVNKSIHYQYSAIRNAYIETVNGVTTPVFNKSNATSTFSLSSRDWQMNGELGLEVDLLPKIYLYRLPVANIGVSGNLGMNFNLNLLNNVWDADASYAIGGKANTTKTLFSFLEPIEVTVPFFEPDKIWQAPSELAIVSGTNQTAKINKTLPQPIVFVVKDNFDFNIPFTKVFFSSNLGSWEQPTVVTDVEGKVANRFTFGNQVEDHLLTAVIKTADNKIIKTVLITLKPVTLPVVSTTGISAITDKTAVSGGNVTADGGTAIISRGICWDTLANATVLNAKTANGSGLGSFVSNMSGLTANTSYFVRAYVINTTDTAYGAEVSFKTPAISDTVTTLIEHGVWKAIGGFGVDGLTTVHPTDDSCDAILDQFGKTDSLHLLFNNNGTGQYKQWDHQWGDSMNNNCIATHYDYFEQRNYGFTWQYMAELKAIRIYFDAAEFYIFDILSGEAADFKILLFNNDKMELLLPGDPWGYEGAAWRALFD